MMKKIAVFLVAAMLLALCACSGADTQQTDDSQTAQTDSSDVAQAEDTLGEADQVQYDYQLKAGEQPEVYDVTFDQMVTVTVDAASTRDGSLDLRSNIYFDNCIFNEGLTIVGDYHAMVSLGEGCSFGDGAVVTCKEATPGSSKELTLEDNLVKVFAACDGVVVETESAFGVVTDGPDVVFNGTTYSKAELAPHTAFLGVYSIYDGDAMTYIKLAIGEDDSIEVLS